MTQNQELTIAAQNGRATSALESRDAAAFTSRELGPWPGKTVTRWTASRLIGRDALISKIHEHVGENVLIVSGTGEAGIGTTSVARRVAHDVADTFPDGCIVINLRSDSPLGPQPLSPTQIQRRVLRSLQPRTDTSDLPADPPSLRRLYQETLAERKALLVFDDATSAAQLRYLLPQKGSAAIVTSQHDLVASHPKLFAATVEGLPVGDAYRLITQVSPAASHLSIGSISSLVTKMQGIPLALRIVAPLLGERSPLLRPRRLLDALDDAEKRFCALRGFHVSNLPVHTAIEVAYELLDAELKPYFESLGVFPAPFTANAAAAVWNTSHERAGRILAQLAALALLDTYPPSPYYEPHRLIQFHARELLLSQPERARDLVSRYVECIMLEVIQASGKSNGTESGYAASDISPYILWEHLPAAWTRAVGGDPAWIQPYAMQRWVCDFPMHSKPLLLYSLSQDEYKTWLEQALEAAEALHDLKFTLRYSSELGQLNAQSGDHWTALDYFKRLSNAAHELQMADIEAEALMYAGLARGALGQVREAEQDWQGALAIFDRIHDRRAGQVQAWLKELRNRFTKRLS